MPVGLQMVGSPFSDIPLLNIALWVERKLDFHERASILLEEQPYHDIALSPSALVDRFRVEFNLDEFDLDGGDGALDIRAGG